jgi:hypothetical protein
VKDVKDIECPSCGNSAMSYADDLTFDAHSTKIIENYTADKPMGRYELNVSTVGGGKLGMYFPR